MMYFLVRKFLKWFCEVAGQQCSGKRGHGHALEWCQYRMGHDGVCKAWDGSEFRAEEVKDDA
jgi:hypothetical protein